MKFHCMCDSVMFAYRLHFMKPIHICTTSDLGDLFCLFLDYCCIYKASGFVRSTCCTGSSQRPEEVLHKPEKVGQS